MKRTLSSRRKNLSLNLSRKPKPVSKSIHVSAPNDKTTENIDDRSRARKNPLAFEKGTGFGISDIAGRRL